jgi:cytochrome c oxidase subunit 1
VYTYLPETGWGPLNLLATSGTVFLVLGVLTVLVDAWRARRVGAVAGDNPWEAGTLEWATSSPPPNSNFIEPPTVGSLNPVWEDPPDQPIVVGLRTDARDVLVTHLLDTEPDHRSVFPQPSIWPLLTAIATSVMFVGSIFTSWAVVYGSIPIFIAMVGWFWPKSAAEGGTQPWPIAHRTLPLPNEAPEGAMP